MQGTAQWKSGKHCSIYSAVVARDFRISIRKRTRMMPSEKSARSSVASSRTSLAPEKLPAQVKHAKASSLGREGLRKRYRPHSVRILFVGESPPASGRFFYQGDSGLYRAVKDTFATAFPELPKSEFLVSFRGLGCYLVDLCGQPVDHMTRHLPECACGAGEIRLARTIRAIQPEIIVAVVRSIRTNVKRAQDQAGWSGIYLELHIQGDGAVTVSSLNVNWYRCCANT
jgi:hypothetical protein